MTDLEWLKKTKEVIETKGWAKGVYGNDVEGYCIMGAAKIASVRRGSLENLGSLEDRMANLLSFGWAHAAIQWNDSRMTSKQDVIDRINGAIHRLTVLENSSVSS